MDIARRRLERVRDAFEGAWRAAGTRHEWRYDVLGERARLRIAGDVLADHLRQVFAHLEADGEAGPLVLTIDLWDARETGAHGLAALLDEVADGRGEAAEDSIAVSSDGRIVSTHGPGRHAWLDRDTGQVVGWFADGRELSPHERSKPLQVLLGLWARDRGVHAVHAALVGRHGRAVLVPGASGAGKSTVAMACLCAGHTFFGDDWVGLARAGAGRFTGFGVYGSALLAPDHAARFPLLEPHVVPVRAWPPGKSLVLVSRAFPEGLGRATRVCALALPRLGDGPGTRVRPASKREALMALVPTSIFTMRPRGGRAELERLGQLVQELPAYWLEMGSRLDDIPHGVDEILARSEASGADTEDAPPRAPA